MWRSDEPPSATALVAASLHFAALPLIASAPSPRVTAPTQRSTSSRAAGARSRTPTPYTSTRNFEPGTWSPHCGYVKTGTPAVSVSSVEFQPQCVTKQAMAGWASTRSCGLHATTSPDSAAASMKPSGSSACASLRTTQRKGRPQFLSPQASSSISSLLSTTTLPTDTYTTESGACVSSHSMQSAALKMSLRMLEDCDLWSGSTRGPTGMRGSRWEMASMASRSSSSKELANTHDAFEMLANCSRITFASTLYGEDGRRKLGRRTEPRGRR
ncbi:hypothetical protein MUK42_34271 [Musa troglodytarum]|uniref:Uncharacterized protein n=1 Tax=Musa troglodytarum TaxID=320322 RepID=A0A9E7JDF9_9LILI|nr:hypothetical protein MUK42_34271 [Musa troglodytarum]